MTRTLRFLALVAALATTLVAASHGSAAAAGGLVQTGTIGGPGHAEIHPSGLELNADGSVLVAADTGNNHIKKYTRNADGTYTKVWDVGSFGSAIGQYNNPRDVGLDNAGNVYVADTVNSRVVKLSGTNGSVIGAPFTTAGTDKFGTPMGVTVVNDTIYLADASKKMVRVLTTSGTQTRAFGGSGACTLSQLRDVTADAAGNIYVANYTLNNIAKFSPTGTCITTWGTKGTGNGQFANPYGVAIGIDGGNEVLYVADSNNNRIQEFTLTGGFLKSFGVDGEYNVDGTFSALRRVAVASGGNVCGADLWGWRISCWQGTAATGYTFKVSVPSTPMPPAGFPENPFTKTKAFNELRQATFDTAGNTYVADGTNHRMIRIDSTGLAKTTCGSRGDTPTSFNWPRGIAFDTATGRIWVADTKQSRLQIIQNPFDACTRYSLGSIGTGVGNFNWPTSVVIRATDGTVWFADSKNHRLSIWDAATRKPIKTFGALGTGTNQFSEPRGVAIGDNGDILVADTKNNRIVRLTANTKAGTITWVRTYTIPSPGLKLPEGVAEAAGRIYIADTAHNKVVVLDSSTGAVLQTLTGFLSPASIAIDPTGRVVVSDTYNDVLKIYTWQ
jgi:sugar lactone lactonase YvrE